MLNKEKMEMYSSRSGPWPITEERKVSFYDIWKPRSCKARDGCSEMEEVAVETANALDLIGDACCDDF